MAQSVVDSIRVTVFVTIWFFSAIVSDINEFHVSINTTYICFAFDEVISRDKIFKRVYFILFKFPIFLLILHSIDFIVCGCWLASRSRLDSKSPIILVN